MAYDPHLEALMDEALAERPGHYQEKDVWRFLLAPER